MRNVTCWWYKRKTQVKSQGHMHQNYLSHKGPGSLSSSGDHETYICGNPFRPCPYTHSTYKANENETEPNGWACSFPGIVNEWLRHWAIVSRLSALSPRWHGPYKTILKHGLFWKLSVWGAVTKPGSFANTHTHTDEFSTQLAAYSLTCRVGRHCVYCSELSYHQGH